MRIITAVTMIGLAAVVGCSAKAGAKNGAVATNPGVTDVSITPTPQPLAAEPVAQPLAQPVVSDTPTQVQAAPAPTPVATPAPSAGGSKYKVQKGDTLWKIATTSYGDGKQWQRIATANPGLTPSTLKVGQTITIP